MRCCKFICFMRVVLQMFSIDIQYTLIQFTGCVSSKFALLKQVVAKARRSVFHQPSFLLHLVPCNVFSVKRLSLNQIILC